VSDWRLAYNGPVLYSSIVKRRQEYRREMISKQFNTVELVVAFIWEIPKKTEILFEAHPLFLFSLF
jgi:hypothetical protein